MINTKVLITITVTIQLVGVFNIGQYFLATEYSQDLQIDVHSSEQLAMCTYNENITQHHVCLVKYA